MTETRLLTDEMMLAFQGVVPSVLASCSAAGVPNVTYISQVFYVDREHVALSRQFFNKTIKNISENPVVCIVLTCPVTYAIYKMTLRFNESVTTGSVFDDMRLQLEVIAGMQGRAETFKLVAADIYSVLSVERVYTFAP